MSRRAPGGLAVISLVLVLTAGGVAGQEPTFPETPEAGVLTLGEALAVARRESPALAQERSGLARAAADRLERVGLLLPSLDASSSFSTSWTRRFTTTDVFGDPTAREEAVEATTRGVTQGLGVSATIFDGSESWTGLRAATARRDAAARSLDARWAEIRAAVATAYFTLMERREAAHVERALLASREADVERTDALFRVAAADAIDLLGARIEARRQAARLAAAQEEAEKSGLELARGMGIGGAVADRLALPIVPFPPDSLDPDALVERALAAHPNVARLDAERRAAEADAAAQGWLAWLPSVTASANYSRSQFGGPDQPFFHLDPRDSAWSVRVSLGVPLFDRFSRQAERARAVAATDRAEAALRGRRLDLEAGVRSRYLDLRNAWRQLDLARGTVELARERVEMAREQHRIAAIDFVRFQAVVDQETDAERKLVRSRYAWYRALVELERAVGGAVALPDGRAP